MEHCAHCGSTDVQQQIHSWQCLVCGKETRSDGAAVKPPRVFHAPGNLERQRISAPWEPDTLDEFYADIPEQGDVRDVNKVVGDRPTWEEPDLKAVGE